MSIKNLKLASYLYLILPVIVFVIGWCKPIYSIPITIALLLVFKLIYKQYKEEHETFITKNQTLIIFIIMILICILAGHGGLFYQSSDWDCRNAIFRDLINFDWPVYYEKSDSALVYYIGQWMVPALIGKLFGFISQDVAWVKGNIALLLWDAIGVTLAILWLIKILKVREKKNIIFAILIFLFFSGLDVIGVFVSKNFFYLAEKHIEWWGDLFQFSSMTTQLFWVFNQCIVPWIITLMFLEEKRVNNYLALILLCLPFGPLPFLGLVIVFACNGICFMIQSIRKKEFKKFIKDVFSLQNILALTSILPIYLFFYMNNASAAGGEDGGGFGFIYRFLNARFIMNILIFWIWEVGIYSIFLWKEHKRNPLFYTVFIALFIIPFFKIGYAADFSMRVSIPAIVIINVWIVQIWLKEMKNKQLTIKWVALTVVLIIGAVTPCFEYYRAFYTVITTGKIDCVADDIKTFSTEEDVASNFCAENPKEDSIFFKYIARK